MAYRYFFEQKLPTDDSSLPQVVTLTGDEAHHLIHVMRVKPGENLILFDGSGAEFDTRIEEVRKKELTTEVRARRVENRECRRAFTLAVALPKGERQRFLIEKLVELGAAEFLPLEAERSVARAGDAAVGRLERVVVEASKQCGRNTLMRIAPPVTSRQLFQTDFPIRCFAHPGGTSILDIVRNSESDCPILVAVGPEGGFSDSETAQALEAGWTPVTLGPRILRTETAAVAVASILSEFVDTWK